MPVWVTGPDGLFYIALDDQGYYAGAIGQKINVHGSPVIVSFDPPIAPTVNLGEVYQMIRQRLGL